MLIKLLEMQDFQIYIFCINAIVSTWLEWSVWIKSEILRKLGMWEYVNQYASCNKLYHSGAKKEKTALQKSCLDYYFLVIVALLILDDQQTLL